jgi:plastocyanin
MMKRIAPALVAVVIGLLAAAPSQGATPKLVATVGPGFTISLKSGATKATKLKAGRYTIAVNDLSASHNFHLTGPGIDTKTSVASTGKTTWTVTFQKGKTYSYVCDPHSSFMKGSFKTF